MPIVNCHLCGAELKVTEIDELKSMAMAKAMRNSACVPKGELFQEIKNTPWKYVCHDCTQKESYWDWANSNEVVEHIAVTAECIINKKA